MKKDPDYPGARHVLSNFQARQSGLTENFWIKAYSEDQQIRSQEQGDLAEIWETPRVRRIKHGEHYYDVLVRIQPEAREYPVCRMTAFSATGPGEPDKAVEDYGYGAELTPAGEAALLDCNLAW